MSILKKLKDSHALEKRIAELEASLRNKDETIQKLEEEKASINKRLENLIFRYTDVDTRFAAMNFRLYQLTQANKVLTMKLTGTAAERDAMRQWVEKARGRGHGEK